MSVRIRTLRTFILCLAVLCSATGLIAFENGDYRSKWGGTWETPALWETYNGSAWVNANSIPPVNISGSVFVRHNLSCYSDLNLTGKIEITNQLYLRSGSRLVINPGADLSLMGNLRLDDQALLINDGEILVSGNNRSITLEAGSVFTNNASLHSTGNRFSFNQLSSSTLILGKQGSITGSGSFTANHHCTIQIAHPQGLDGAIGLGGNENFDQVYFVFNGTEPQITGTSMPTSALGIVFANPAGTFLSQNISIVEEVLVTQGSTLDFGTNILNRAYWGAGHFIMETGSTLYTAHPQGISSTGEVGSVRLTQRDFSSYGNYGFNGNQPQEISNFTTVPATDPEGRVVVGNIIVDNDAGVSFNDPLLILEQVIVNSGTAVGNVQIDGNESLVDGIDSSYYYHRFEPNGVPIRAYRPHTDILNNQQSAIRRRWVITGNFTGTKRVTFFWDAADDNGLNWSDGIPVVKKGNQILRSELFDTHSNPRWITVDITDLNSRANFSILMNGDDTLPVQLSSFDALPIQGDKIRVRWVSQTETALSGYYILRSTESVLAKAQIISSLIAATNSSNLTSYSFDDRELYSSGVYYYWLQSLDLDGGTQYHGPVMANLSFSDPQTPQPQLVTGLKELFPNPFNPDLSIAFELAIDSRYDLAIYNQRGQLVKNLSSGLKNAGAYKLIWDGRDNRGIACSSGTYLIILDTADQRSIKRATLVK